MDIFHNRHSLIETGTKLEGQCLNKLSILRAYAGKVMTQLGGVSVEESDFNIGF